MKFTVDQQALTEGVNWVSRSLSTRPIKTELLGIKIDATGDEVILSASDLETSSKANFNADISTKGEVLVPELAHFAAHDTDQLGDHRVLELAEAMKALGIQLLGLQI